MSSPPSPRLKRVSAHIVEVRLHGPSGRLRPSRLAGLLRRVRREPPRFAPCPMLRGRLPAPVRFQERGRDDWATGIALLCALGELA